MRAFHGRDVMQLLPKRNQSVAPTGYIRFDLWAKFDVTSEENALIDKYGVYQAILSEGHTRRDLIRAFIFGVLLTVVMYSIIRYINPQTDMGAVIGIFALAVTFFGGTYYIYHQ